MPGRGKGLGKAVPLVLAAGAAFAISRYRLHEQPLLAYKRIKHKFLSIPPPKMDTGPFDWEAIRATADATMRVDTQDGTRYLETWVRGEESPKRVHLQDGGVQPGSGRGGKPKPFTGFTIPQNIIDVFQSPGRQQVHMGGLFTFEDTFWFIKDDANLLEDQMFITFDVLAPRVSWAKELEAWVGNRTSLSVTLTAEMIQLPFGTGAFCVAPSAATDYVNNCSNVQAALITRAQMDFMWFRKPSGFLFPTWRNIGAFNSSVWAALGGKVVRIIWETD